MKWIENKYDRPEEEGFYAVETLELINGPHKHICIAYWDGKKWQWNPKDGIIEFWAYCHFPKESPQKGRLTGRGYRNNKCRNWPDSSCQCEICQEINKHEPSD